MSLSKKDLIVGFVCIAFLLATLGAIGKTGRRRAKELLCLSNLGRWGQVFLDYAADNDSYFMRGWFSGSETPGPFHTDYWMEALRPYYGNPDLRCCPEATKTQMNADGTVGLGTGEGTFTAWGVFPGECGEASSWWGAVTACDYGSYGMNAWVCDPPADAPIFEGHDVANNNWRTVNVAGGQNIPVLIGAQWIEAWPDATDPVPRWDGEPWWGAFSDYGFMMCVCINRHNGCVNSAFLDASARKVPLKCLWKLKWHRTFDPEQGPTEEEFNSAGDGWMAQFPPCE